MDEWIRPEILITLSVTIIGVIVWFVRLEGKVNQHKALCDAGQLALKETMVEAQKDIDCIRNRQEIIDEKVATELKHIALELAQIKGYLQHLQDKNGQ